MILLVTLALVHPINLTQPTETTHGQEVYPSHVVPIICPSNLETQDLTSHPTITVKAEIALGHPVSLITETVVVVEVALGHHVNPTIAVKAEVDPGHPVSLTMKTIVEVDPGHPVSLITKTIVEDLTLHILPTKSMPTVAKFPNSILRLIPVPLFVVPLTPIASEVSRRIPTTTVKHNNTLKHQLTPQLLPNHYQQDDPLKSLSLSHLQLPTQLLRYLLNSRP
jgi:hypothetical protein